MSEESLPVGSIKKAPEGLAVVVLCDQPNKTRWCIIDAWGPLSFPQTMWLPDSEVEDWETVYVPQ